MKAHAHHRYVPDRGVFCGQCGANCGVFGPHPWWSTCDVCGLEAPIDDFNLMPGMPEAHPVDWCAQCRAGSTVATHDPTVSVP